MLAFIRQLDRVIKLWPDNTKWTMAQIGEYTETPLPYVVDYLTDALGKPLDVHEPMTFHEASKALGVLKQRKHQELEALRLKEIQEIEKTVDLYNQISERIRIMEASKNWRGAYKSISYFIGTHADKLPHDSVVGACNDALRFGIKAGINFQELSSWLTRGIRMLLKRSTPDSIDDALDFIDAYGEFFASYGNGKGENFLQNLFLTLKPSVEQYGLNGRYHEVLSELKIEPVVEPRFF